MVLTSCNKGNKESERDIRIAKKIPEISLSADDSNFSIGQDTLYYKGRLYCGKCYKIYPSADTAWVGAYFNGVEEGIQKKWYKGGQPEEERFYINGKKEGLQRGWWPNGNLRFQFTTYNNEFEYKFEEWAINGLLIKRFNYKNGYESGRQQLWWGDGTIRANYEIKNGRKYGLLGYKLCANPYDSVITK